MAASIIKILNIMGAKGAAQKLPDKNMGDASELFTGMLACARIAQPAANSDGQRPHAAGKGRCAPLSKNPKTTQLSGLLEKKFTAIPNAGSPKADRRSPGKVNLLPKGHGDTQNKKTACSDSP